MWTSFHHFSFCTHTHLRSVCFFQVQHTTTTATMGMSRRRYLYRRLAFLLIDGTGDVRPQLATADQTNDQSTKPTASRRFWRARRADSWQSWSRRQRDQWPGSQSGRPLICLVGHATWRMASSTSSSSAASQTGLRPLWDWGLGPGQGRMRLHNPSWQPEPSNPASLPLNNIDRRDNMVRSTHTS